MALVYWTMTFPACKMMILYTFRKFNWWRYCLALCDEMFAHFPLFDETLHHIELWNQSNTAKSAQTFLTMYTCRRGRPRPSWRHRWECWRWWPCWQRSGRRWWRWARRSWRSWWWCPGSAWSPGNRSRSATTEVIKHDIYQLRWSLLSYCNLSIYFWKASFTNQFNFDETLRYCPFNGHSFYTVKVI